MEDFFYAGGLRGADGAASAIICTSIASPSPAGRSARTSRAPRSSTTTSSARSTTRSTRRRARRAEGQPRARRLRHQAGACEPQFLKHTGPALVFDDYPVDEGGDRRRRSRRHRRHVLVLRNAGPQGGPGMPEWGMLPMPKKLLKQGVRDMLRLSDARMSGTSYGACVLHVAPESLHRRPAGAGADRRHRHARRRRAHHPTWRSSDEELARRRAAWKPPEPRYERGYGWMFSRTSSRPTRLRLRLPAKPISARPVAEPAIY